MKTIVVFLVLVTYAKAAVEETPYEVIETATDYEVRRYPQRKWVATTLEALSYDSVTNDLFQTLFQYIDGGNSEGATIPMTAPVTSLVIPGVSTEGSSTFTMAFYIPEEFQASPPSPTNPNIFIEDRPEFELYSRRFTGYAYEEEYTAEANALYLSLERDGIIDAQYAPWYIVGYNSPFDFVNRRNEVWYPRKSVKQH